MRTLILHTGLMKCATTSIQHSLHRARKLLAGRGISYWGIMATHNEPLWALSQSRFNGITPARKAQFGAPEAIEHDLARFLAGPQQFSILSSEHMGQLQGQGSSAPGPDDVRGKLRRAALAAGFDRVRIIAYIRPPVAWWASMIQERCKSKPWDEAIRTETRYRPMLAPLEELFPEAETVLRPFDPAAFAGGSILQDFFDAAGLPAAHLDGVEEVRANASLSHEGTLFLDHLWRQAGPQDSLGMSFMDGYLRPDFDSGNRFRLPADLVAELVERNRDDLAWISARMGRDMVPVLNPESYPPPRNTRGGRVPGGAPDPASVA